ncbi:MAG: 4Fe-4S dicluster domain-containing protein [Bacillota bacterium]
MSSQVSIADNGLCSGCQLCALACSFFVGKEHNFNPSRARIMVKRVKKQNSFHVSLTETCTHCGKCIDYCNYGVLVKT